MGDVIISAASGVPIAVVANPIYDINNFGDKSDKLITNNSRLIGILGVDLDFKIYDDFLKSLPIQNNERVVLVDTFANKIADSTKSNLINESSTFSNLSSFKKAIKGISGHAVEKFDNIKMRISYAPVKSIQNTWALLWIKPYNNTLNSN